MVCVRVRSSKLQAHRLSISYSFLCIITKFILEKLEFFEIKDKIEFENYIFYLWCEFQASNFSRALTIVGALKLPFGCAFSYQYHVKLHQHSPLHTIPIQTKTLKQEKPKSKLKSILTCIYFLSFTIQKDVRQYVYDPLQEQHYR